MCAVAPTSGILEKIGFGTSKILQKPFKMSELLLAVDDLLLNRADAAPVVR